MNSERAFKPPPEAPVVFPTAEQFLDPIAYLSTLQPLLLKYGICKIRPPPSWKPPFCINEDKFSFKPRVQQINELEAQTRVKLEFLDRLAKFWELQGQAFKVPMVDRKPLDMATLFKNAVADGGYEEITRTRKWRKICRKMNLEGAVSAVKHHYEKYLYPYERFLVRDNKISTPTTTPTSTPQKKSSVAGTPSRHGASSCNVSPATMSGGETSPTSSSPLTPKKLRSNKPAGKEEVEVIDLSCSKTTKELRKLQFLAPGPKALLSNLTPRNNTDVAMAIRRKRLASLDLDPDFSIAEPPQKVSCMSTTSDSIARRTRRAKTSQHKSMGGYLEVCQGCDGFGQQEEILTCCQCAASYHTYCLDPPWEGVPTPQWRCAVCISEEYNKPSEVFGFEQANKEYTLREYSRMANKFKEDYFSEPVINPFYEEGLNSQENLTVNIPCTMVEQEYWTVVSELDSGVIVEYGADLHSSKHGSGFPLPSKARSEEEKYYANSGWNLNNLPVLEGSVLKYISVNISGMKVPWVYAGMCFSSFCWHTEDHWMYSINYLHRGQPKTWYGVPPSYAEALEQTMRDVAPELFEAQPDLMHHLVTILSPNELMKNNIPVVRTDQCEGEFIVTGPRAYHAGFNQGFNVAEAVNFALPEWIPFGRRSISHYSLMKRKPVFSHDELMCLIVQKPDSLSSSLQKACYQDLKELVKEHEEYFQTAANMGVDPTAYERVFFERLSDQQRDCYYCHTVCFMAVFKCSCIPEDGHFACLRHLQDHNKCPSGDISIKYRYTVNELKGMMTQLQDLVNPMKDWDWDVKKRLSGKKEDIGVLRNLLQQGHSLMKMHSYDSEVVHTLSNVIEEAEMCEKIAVHLLSYSNASSDKEVNAMLSFNEVKNVAKKFEGLPCTIEHGEQLMACFKKVEELALRLAIEKEIAQRTLEMNDYRVNSSTETLHQEYLKCGVVITVGEQLKGLMSLKKWCHEGEKYIKFPQDGQKMLLSGAEAHLKKGEDLKLLKALSSKVVEKHLVLLKDLIRDTLLLNDKMQGVLKLTKWESVEPVGELVGIYKTNPFQLDSGEELIKVHVQVSQWMQVYDTMTKVKGRLPTVQEAKTTLSQGLSLPVQLSCVLRLQDHLDSMKQWLSNVESSFLHAGSKSTLLEVLLPRSSPTEAVFKRVNADSANVEKSYTFTEVLSKLNNFEKAIRMIRDRENRDEAYFEKLRLGNTPESGSHHQVCGICSKLLVRSLPLVQCQLCLKKYHSNCMSRGEVNPDSSAVYHNFFLCLNCMRSRRPPYSTAVAFYKEGTGIGIYTPEVAALGCLVLRANEWQKSVTPLIEKALSLMNVADPHSQPHSVPSSSNSSGDNTTTQETTRSSGRFCTVAVQTDSSSLDNVVHITNDHQDALRVSTTSTTPTTMSGEMGIGSMVEGRAGNTTRSVPVSSVSTNSLLSNRGTNSTAEEKNTSQVSTRQLPSRLRMELYQWRLKGAFLELKLEEMEQLSGIFAQDDKLTKLAPEVAVQDARHILQTQSRDVMEGTDKSPYLHVGCSSAQETTKEVCVLRVERAASTSQSSNLQLLNRCPCTVREKRSNSDQVGSPTNLRTSVIAEPSLPVSRVISKRRFSLPVSSVTTYTKPSVSRIQQPDQTNTVYQILNNPVQYQSQKHAIVQRSTAVQPIQPKSYVQHISVPISAGQPTLSVVHSTDCRTQQRKKVASDSEAPSGPLYMMVPTRSLSQTFSSSLPRQSQSSQQVQPVSIRPVPIMPASQLPHGVIQAAANNSILTIAQKRPPSPEVQNKGVIQSKKPSQVGVHRIVSPQSLVQSSNTNLRLPLNRTAICLPQGAHKVQNTVYAINSNTHQVVSKVLTAGQTFYRK